MQVCLDEAKEGWSNEMIVELNSNNVEDLNENVERTKAWMKQWMMDQQKNQSK